MVEGQAARRFSALFSKRVSAALTVCRRCSGRPACRRGGTLPHRLGTGPPRPAAPQPPPPQRQHRHPCESRNHVLRVPVGTGIGHCDVSPGMVSHTAAVNMVFCTSFCTHQHINTSTGSMHRSTHRLLTGRTGQGLLQRLPACVVSSSICAQYLVQAPHGRRRILPPTHNECSIREDTIV